MKCTDYFQEDLRNILRNRTLTPRKGKMAVNCILRAAAMKLKGKIYKRVTEILRNNCVTLCCQNSQ